MSKGIRFKKDFSTWYNHTSRRLSKAGKGKGIARSRNLEMPEDILRSSSLDPKEKDFVLEKFSDEFGCDWVSASRASQAVVAAKT